MVIRRMDTEDLENITSVPFSVRVLGRPTRTHDSLDWDEQAEKWRCNGAWLADICEPPIAAGFEGAVATIHRIAEDGGASDLTWDGPAPQPGGPFAVY